MNGSLSSFDLDYLVRRTLEEDVPHGDVTTNLLVPPDAHTIAMIQAKQELTVAGIPVLREVFKLLDPSVTISVKHGDGEPVRSSDVIALLEGPTRSILTGERVALNFLQHLSGIATLTRKFCQAIQGYSTKILDTRKTIPGLRNLEKWAVTMGGGTNHRFSLSDGILIKDNHLAVLCAQGFDITQTCRRAKEKGPHGLKVCIEIASLDQIDQALQGQADVLLLDNMTPDLVRQGVSQIKGRAIVEVSGGITLTNVREFAAAGAEFISIGALTHSAPAVDINLFIPASP